MTIIAINIPDSPPLYQWTEEESLCPYQEIYSGLQQALQELSYRKFIKSITASLPHSTRGSILYEVAVLIDGKETLLASSCDQGVYPLAEIKAVTVQLQFLKWLNRGLSSEIHRLKVALDPLEHVAQSAKRRAEAMESAQKATAL